MKKISGVEFQNKLKAYIVDEKKRMRLQFYVFYAMLSFVAFVMTILNVVTKKPVGLTLSTAIFSAACVINIILHHFGGIPSKIAAMLFCAEIIALFVFFIISGNPEGFSVIWIAMLPNFGLLLFKRKWGSVFSLSILLMLIFFFWTPWGKGLLLYDYNKTFMMRFPIVYMVFYVIGLLLEVIRTSTYNELIKTQSQMEHAYTHDALTGVYNRYGFRRDMDAVLLANKDVAFAIFDLDDFKRVNDTYGHRNGDVVLKTVSKIAEERSSGFGELCRWGGEEFVILFPDGSKAETVCNDILTEVGTYVFDFDGQRCGITLSFGIVRSAVESPDPDELFVQADTCLYEAKQTGKNKIVVKDFVK